MVNKKTKDLYRYLTEILIISILFQIPSTYAVCIYGDGVYGSGVYGGDCPTGGGASEGGGAFWSIPLSIANNSGLVNGTCREKQQVFNGYCYDCNPINSYLTYSNSTKTLNCNTCNPGYLLYNDGCITSQEFGKTIVSQNSSLNLSFFILIIVILLAFYWNANRIKKRRVVEADNADEED